MSEEQERRAIELGRNEEADVEGHKHGLERAETGRAEEERRENDDPDVEGHAFELGRNTLDRNDLGRNTLDRSDLGRNEGV